MNGSATLFAMLITCVTGYAASEHLHTMVQEIVRKYLSVSRCIVIITDEHDSIRVVHPSVIHVNGENASVDLLKAVYEQSCSGFVIRTSRLNRRLITAVLIEAYKKSVYARYNDKRYLFLPENDEDSDTTFLDDDDMYFMPNLVFVSRSGGSYQVIGHNYFHGYKYDVLNIKHEVLDEWNPDVGFVNCSNLFPEKIQNLHGKLLRFSLLNYSPYALVLQQNDSVVYDGLETRLAAEFVAASNGTWTGLDNPVHLWGELFGNGSGTGVFGTVLENKADLGFSAIYQWYCDVMECSHPYIHSDVTCLAPKPQMLPEIMTIVLPLEEKAWAVFIFIFVLSGLFTCFLTSAWAKISGVETKNSLCWMLLESFYDIFRLQLMQTPRWIQTKTPVANCYKVWGIYTFLMTLLWQCGISSLLTAPRYERPIKDARDLVEKFPKVRWGANHIAWVESIRDSGDPILEKIVSEFVVQDAEMLKKRASKKDFAYFMEKLQNGHYALDTYFDEDGLRYLRLMDNNIYGGYIVMILTRGSPYQERLDDIILRMFDTGLVLKMELQVALERMNNKLQEMVRSSSEKPSRQPTTLLVTHIQGALYIYAGGISISVVVFIAELQYSKRQAKRDGLQRLF